MGFYNIINVKCGKKKILIGTNVMAHEKYFRRKSCEWGLHIFIALGKNNNHTNHFCNIILY